MTLDNQKTVVYLHTLSNNSLKRISGAAERLAVKASDSQAKNRLENTAKIIRGILIYRAHENVQN